MGETDNNSFITAPGFPPINIYDLEPAMGETENISFLTTPVLVPSATTPTQNTDTEINLCLRVMCGICLFLIFVLAVFGNSIVCLIVFKKPSMRSAINLLLATLALSHILQVIGCIPFAFVTLITSEWIFGDVMCDVTSVLHMLFICESAWILTAISMDRYLIIVRRKDKLTSPKAKVMILALLGSSCVVAIPPCLGWSAYVPYNPLIQCVLQESKDTADRAYIITSYCLVFYFPALTMAFCYIAIYRKIQMNLRKITNYPAVVDNATALKLGLHLPPVNPPTVDMSFKTRAYKTILMLFLVFVVCWSPYSICFMVWNLKQKVRLEYTWGSVVIIMGYLNTAINPIVYFWRIRKFKDACVELLPKLSNWIPGLKVRTRRRINPSRAYRVQEVATVSQQSM